MSTRDSLIVLYLYALVFITTVCLAFGLVLELARWAAP